MDLPADPLQLLRALNVGPAGPVQQDLTLEHSLGLENRRVGEPHRGPGFPPEGGFQTPMQKGDPSRAWTSETLRQLELGVGTALREGSRSAWEPLGSLAKCWPARPQNETCEAGLRACQGKSSPGQPPWATTSVHRA